MNELASDEGDPASTSERNEDKACILQALNKLNRKEQEVVRLKFLHELSYKEIAELTGLKTGNVGFILHSSLEKMHQILHEQAAVRKSNTLPRAPRV